MTYVELIIVLSIFAAMSGVTMYSYKKFQAKVDIRVLANDIALKLVEAQKAATSGKQNSVALLSDPNWKPSYGVYFNRTTSGTNTSDKIFYYFVDLDQNKRFLSFICSNTTECIEKFNIGKGDYVSSTKVYFTDTSSSTINSDLNLTFTRPNYGVSVYTTSLLSNVDRVEITIASSADSSVSSVIKVYASGRIQID